MWVKLKRRLYSHIGIIRLFVLFLFLGLVVFVGYLFLLKFVDFLHPVFTGSEAILGVVGSTEGKLDSWEGRTNILLMGKGGENHSGADLTDSMIFVSLDHSNKNVLLVAVPRDIWIESMQAKINTAYYYGNKKQQGGGLILSRAVVEEVLGQPVHYALVLDFSGFVEAVDLIGGVEIDVKNGFDDYKYPIPGKENVEPEKDRYEHLHFEPGIQIMDGRRALKFVRSRNAEGDEGTDFARSRRQQEVMEAFVRKLFSMKTLFNLSKMRDLARLLGDHIDTNIEPGEYGAFLKLAMALDGANIKVLQLDTGETDDRGKVVREGLLMHPKIHHSGQWVLLPRAGDWSEVHKLVADNLR